MGFGILKSSCLCAVVLSGIILFGFIVGMAGQKDDADKTGWITIVSREFIDGKRVAVLSSAGKRIADYSTLKDFSFRAAEQSQSYDKTEYSIYYPSEVRFSGKNRVKIIFDLGERRDISSWGINRATVTIEKGKVSINDPTFKLRQPGSIIQYRQR